MVNNLFTNERLIWEWDISFPTWRYSENINVLNGQLRRPKLYGAFYVDVSFPFLGIHSQDEMTCFRIL